jgi:hypothetical protein
LTKEEATFPSPDRRVAKGGDAGHDKGNVMYASKGDSVNGLDGAVRVYISRGSFAFLGYDSVGTHEGWKARLGGMGAACSVSLTNPWSGVSLRVGRP